jgi:hypothetical protein
VNTNKLFRFGTICLLFLFAVNQSAQAAETKDVVVTGYGINPETATKNAWDNAISQVVGLLVDAQPVIENDQVLSHSSGFIEAFEVLNESASGGLFTVQIKATVRLTQLQENLQTVGLIKVEVDAVSTCMNLFCPTVGKSLPRSRTCSWSCSGKVFSTCRQRLKNSGAFALSARTAFRFSRWGQPGQNTADRHSCCTRCRFLRRL